MKIIQITTVTAGMLGEEAQIKELLGQHLLSLSNEDRYLRFCHTLRDEAILSYVNRIDLSKDGIFVIFDQAGQNINAFLHASRIDQVLTSEYEFGLTVDEALRHQGVGYELFKTALTWAMSLGCKRVYVNCLYQNKAMQRIAQRFNMEMRQIDFETREAEITIPNNYVDLISYFSHTVTNQMLLCDLAYRRNVHAVAEQLQAIL